MVRYSLALLSAAVAHSVIAQSQRIYIALDDHTDYFWTATEDTYREVFQETLDYYLDQADATEGNPPEFQARWNCDGSLWMWTYEKNKGPDEFARLMTRVRDGHIGVPLNALCVCLGGSPAEAVLRGMYYPGQIERRHEVRFRLAYTMENQTQPFGLNALWAGSGARYAWKGICGCDTRTSSPGDREHDIYWAASPDGSRILTKWNSMLFRDCPPWENQSMGGYAEARCPESVVELVTSDPTFKSRYPYDVIGCFGKGWDDLKTLTDEFVTVAMNKSNENRQVIVSNETDFFEDFEAEYGGDIPQVAVSFGNEWELYCATMAETSARIKRAVEKLRAAEAMATLVSLHEPDFMTGRETARDQAWMNLGLYWEHDFGMAGFSPNHPWVALRIAWQNRLADEIDAYVNRLHDDAAAALGALIESGGGNRLFVFNPLAWERTDFADFSYDGPEPVHVVAVADDVEVPSQIVTVDGQRRLRLWCEAVPSLGYAAYEIREGAGQSFPPAAAVNGNVIESDRYRITLADRGAITSLIDKGRGDREFAASIGGLTINDLGASSGAIDVVNSGPVSVTLTASAPSPVAHTSSITLFRDSSRIAIENRITQNFDATQMWAFSFALEDPFVRHEEVGAILRARTSDQGGDYSTRNARYDWLTLNHFADMAGAGGLGVTLSNADCYFMNLGNSTPGTLDMSTPRIRALAGGRVVDRYGIVNQGGASEFLQRFALQTRGGYDAVAAMRFSLEHQNPLVCAPISGENARLPADGFSALSIADPGVILWAFKPAEEGIEKGIIARLWNVTDTPRSTDIALSAFQVAGGRATTHIETNEGLLDVSPCEVALDFTPQQMRTIRLLSGETVISKLKCKPGRGKLKAKVRTDVPPGAEVTLTNNGGDPRTVAVKSNGRAVARWKRQQGTHEVCIEGCPVSCRSEVCNP